VRPHGQAQDQGLRAKEQHHPALSVWTHGVRPGEQEHGKKGLHPNYMPKWVFNFTVVIFIYLWPNIGRFWPFWEDLGPFLRPYIGGKLGDGNYQLQAYINQRLLKPWEEVQSREMLHNC
jgi:hypothetical protein